MPDIWLPNLGAEPKTSSKTENMSEGHGKKHDRRYKKDRLRSEDIRSITSTKRGRQAKRWMDDIRKIGEATWSRKARDREEWKRLEEAYVSQDTLINLG
ncbi:hypothetical protein EVAR_12046_1 [Eumeta japonica]|uniref:Uncharacterized protein n=1 Tax=Eumeta variegata TaxID=151549 RepID=A0A4C1U4X3_EUMVA|nr:hypothetical protein EVAR_12046_1 [Eumeta japonica]